MFQQSSAKSLSIATSAVQGQVLCVVKFNDCAQREYWCDLCKNLRLEISTLGVKSATVLQRGKGPYFLAHNKKELQKQ